MATRGTFVLADISGYTEFLTGVAIEHAKEITSDLFKALLKANGGRWKVGNVEGDCIFFYREGTEPPDELLSHVKLLHERFCERVIDIAMASSCECGACSRTNRLAMKFVAHAGEFEFQEIGGRKELIGADVVVAHRLLKNSVPLEEYLLLTDGCCADPAGLDLPGAQGSDEYDAVGRVEYSYMDLSPLRDEMEERNRFFITPEEARMTLTLDIEAPPDVVWEALQDREKRLKWQGHSEIIDLPGPRGSLGSVHRCIWPNGSREVHATIAIDEQGRRATEKAVVTPLMKDSYWTTEVTERPGGGSRVGFYMKFDFRWPIVSHLGLMAGKPFARRQLEGEYRRLKAYCETGEDQVGLSDGR